MIFLDFETRSRQDLTKVGSYRYCEDPSTEAYCLAYAMAETDTPQLWIQDQPPPKLLMDAIKAGEKISGWNALSFERRVFQLIMGPRHGWAVPRLEQWHDTMHDALSLALPASLDQCAKAIPGLPEKDGKGRKAMLKLCKPVKKTGEFLLDRGGKDKQTYLDVYKYCRQDVVTERAISCWLPRHVSGLERELELFTARVNDRGIPIDVPFVNAVVAVLGEHMERLNEEFHTLTGIDSATKRDKVKDWCNERLGKYDQLPNMQALTLDSTLKCLSGEPDVHRVLTIYRAMSHTSVAKFNFLKNAICKDGTVKDNLIFHKASTGRDAGAGFQPQNLPNAQTPDPEWMIELFLNRDIETIKLFGDPLEVAAALVRRAIKAPPGYKFVDGDLKQIEARKGAWIAKEEDILESFREDKDLYKVTASKMFKVPYEQVDKTQRTAGKVGTLSGQFGGGEKAIVAGAVKGGLSISLEDAIKIKKDFRAARPQLVRSWYAFGDAAINAVRNPGRAFPVETNTDFVFGVKGAFLFMRLPNGRLLSFPFPKVENKETPWGEYRDVVTAMWIDSSPGGNHHWSRRKIIGSNFFQSAVQGLSRDVLMEAGLRIEAAGGWPIILRVHDELVSLVEDTPQYSYTTYEKMMSHTPTWAPGLPVASEGWEGERFKKD